MIADTDRGMVGRTTASVIIVTHNGWNYMNSCLTSVEGQLGPEDEIVVVDNASTDGGPGLMRSRLATVILVENAENRGFAPACNQGAALAGGDILVFLNQDARVEPGWLEALIHSLEEESAVGLTTSKVLLMSHPDRIQLCGQDLHFTGLPFLRGFGARAEVWNVPEGVAAVSGASFAIRRELWQALEGFDETFYMYFEETDLCWRARLAGHRCHFVPRSVVHHDYRPSQPNHLRFYYSARNRYLMLLKNWRWGTLLLLLPSLFLAEVVDWFLALAMRGESLQAKARANVWLLGHLSEIRAQRAASQAGRTVSDAVILAERMHRLEPLETSLGRVGTALLSVCNGLFRINHCLVLTLCRWLGW